MEEFFYNLGRLGKLLWSAIRATLEIHKIGPNLIESLYSIGVESIPLVTLTSLFTGMVASVQTAYQVRDYMPLDFLGAGVAKAVMVELSPVLTALVLAGRVGAGIAAELGTMRVTEQIDALELMAIDPARFLILPRLISGTIMTPLLTVLSEFVALLGASFVSFLVLDISFSTFFHGVRLFFVTKDLFGGLAKSVVFGFIIAFMGCYFGYYTEGGAVGVGKSTTKAVVYSALLILLFDYILGSLIFAT